MKKSEYKQFKSRGKDINSSEKSFVGKIKIESFIQRGIDLANKRKVNK